MDSRKPTRITDITQPLNTGMVVYSGAEEGEYWPVTLPLPLVGVEGAPVRAVLIELF